MWYICCLCVGVVWADQRGRADCCEADWPEHYRHGQGSQRVREGAGGGGTPQESPTQEHRGVSEIPAVFPFTGSYRLGPEEFQKMFSSFKPLWQFPASKPTCNDLTSIYNRLQNDDVAHDFNHHIYTHSLTHCFSDTWAQALRTIQSASSCSLCRADLSPASWLGLEPWMSQCSDATPDRSSRAWSTFMRMMSYTGEQSLPGTIGLTLSSIALLLTVQSYPP